MTKLFLSYARGDDEPFVRRLYGDLTTRGFDVWFDRESMPWRSLTFHQEIRDAVAACDRLLLVVGPKAVSSAYVQQEWQFAWFEAEKVVTPIVRIGDYPLAIDELPLLHGEDFRDDAEYAVHLDQLVRILKKPPPPLGKLIGAPSLPTHYLSRADRLIALRDAVQSGLDSLAPFGGTVACERCHGIAGASKHVGMHGMGGIGKSVLANLLARDRGVRKSFPDGIVWVGLGSLPKLDDLMRSVHRALGGDGAFATQHEGKVKLEELLADKAVLLILDDAWRQSDVEAFNVLGPRCRALVTTRDAGLLSSLGGSHHLVELLTDEEALWLLAVTVGKEPQELPTEARLLLSECGRLPLAVSLAGGMVAEATQCSSVLSAFERHKLEFFADEHRAEEQHQSLWKAIEVSVLALEPAEQARLVELGVFPADETVPEAAVAALWQHTGGLDDLDTQGLLIKFKQRSLVQLTSRESDGDQHRVGLHELIHDYCLRRAQVELGAPATLHTRLLDAYRALGPDGWWTGPNDGYFLDHLRDHLVAAGRGEELADLLHALRWLETKNAAGLAFDLPHDFRTAIETLSKQDDRRRMLRLLDEALRRDLHFIDRHRDDYPQALFQCLWNTGWWYDCPQAAEHYENGQAPGDATARPFSRLLERIVSGSDGKTLQRWDAESRTEMAVCGHEHRTACVAFSPDGLRIVGGSWDGTVRLWDAESGAELAVLRGHGNSVNSVAFSPDGLRIVGGLGDWKVRLWNPESRAVLAVLGGHEGGVNSVAFSPNGRRIVSGSDDGTVRLWDAESGAELAVLRGHGNSVNSVAFSPDGLRIVSGSDDWTVQLWDAESGAKLALLHGHEGWVNSVAFSPDGRRIVSNSNDKTVRVWDAETCKCREVIEVGGDVPAIVAMSEVFPWRAMIRGGETATGQPFAQFPIAFEILASAPNGRRWAGSNSFHLYLIQLEGVPPTASADTA